MKNGDIFEACGGYCLYMGNKIYTAHQGKPLIESEIRLGKWTVYRQPVYLTPESELRMNKALSNIGRRLIRRLEEAENGETRYCGPCFSESTSLEEATLYYEQMQRLDSIWSRIRLLQWKA